MPQVKKALFGIFTVFTFFLLFFASPIHAQTGQQLSIQNYRAQQNTHFSIKNVEFGIDCEGVGTGFIANQDCLGYDPATGQVEAYKMTPDGGAIGGLNSAMMAMVSTPPASATEYVAYLGSNLGLVPKAYAQVTGSGSGVIQPVFALWRVIRDVSYLGFILVFIIIGFMIMFRQRLNPQTVITVQSALPGLVIGLILVTFSYFIAALLIDVSFFVVQIMASLFGQAGANGLGTPDQLVNIGQKADIFTLFRTFVLNGNTMGTVAAPIITAFNTTPGTTGIPLQGITLGIIAALNPAGSVVSGLVITILIIAVIIQCIRLVWALLQAYIAIFVNTILGPIFILYSTLPGRRGALTFWWKNILGNALIFPAVFAAILFAGFIVGSPDSQFGASLPFLAFPQGTLRGILAFGIVLGTPAIPKIVKSAFGVKDLGDIASVAIGGAAAGYAAARGGTGYAYSGAMEQLGIPGRRKALQEMDVKSGRNSAQYSTGSLRDFWAKHGPGK